MTLLQIFFIISGVIILLLSIDIARKEKFNALHFFVFLMIGGGLLVFTFFPRVLDILGNIVGLQRGADALVYGSIIFLIYMTLLILTKVENNKHSITKLIREYAIQNSSKKEIIGKEVFLVRVYNEASVLENTLQHIIDAGYENILAIDDGSQDTSWKILKKLSEKYTKMRIVRHSQNRGGGAALETGFEYIRRYAEVEYVVTFDADGQHQIEDLKKFMKAFEKYPHLDVVFGSRFLKQKDTKSIPLVRKIILRGGKIFTKLMSGIILTDAHNGYRVLRLSTLKNIHLSADSMAYASELIDQIAVKKLAYAEVPVHVLYTEYSLTKGQKSSNAIFIALHTIWSKFLK